MKSFFPLLLLWFGACFLQAEEWSGWRGPLGNGTWVDAPAISQDPDGLKRLWRTPIGSGYSGVTVADGRVYTMDKQGEGAKVTERVLCLDEDSGQLVWKHEYMVSQKKLINLLPLLLVYVANIDPADARP